MVSVSICWCGSGEKWAVGLGAGGLRETHLVNWQVHISNTWSVKSPTTVVLLKEKKILSSLENVKVLSPAAFRSTVCGSSGEMAAGTDHAQDTVRVHQQPGMNPHNGSFKPRSFKKMGEPQPACSELSACKHWEYWKCTSPGLARGSTFWIEKLFRTPHLAS